MTVPSKRNVLLVRPFQELINTSTEKLMCRLKNKFVAQKRADIVVTNPAMSTVCIHIPLETIYGFDVKT